MINPPGMKGRRMSLACQAADGRRFENFDQIPMTSRGFSFIELLVTLAIILILFTLYWRSTAGRRERERQAAAQESCQRNLEKTFVALQIYATDHAGGFPNMTNAHTSEEPLDVLVPRYTADTSVFVCPGSQDAPLPSGESLLKHKISYSYYMGRRASDTQQVLMSDRQVDTLPKAAGQLVFSADGKPPGNNHGGSGGNLLFGDGHAEASPAHTPFSIAQPPGVVLLNPRQ